MRFGFLNNFAVQIAAPVAITDTSIELSAGADLIATALQDADAVALTLFATDAQGNETKREVVYATAATPPMVTVTRAQEDTTALAFDPGDGVEARLTAAPFSRLEPNRATGHQAIAWGAESTGTGDESVVIGVRARSESYDSVAIGHAAKAFGDESVVIGHDCESHGGDSVVIGLASLSYGDDSVVIGDGAESSDNGNVLIGNRSTATGDHSVVLGEGSDGEADDTVSIGQSASATVIKAVAVGQGADAKGENAVALGARAQALGAYSAALGAYSATHSEGAIAINTDSNVYGLNSITIGLFSSAGSETAVADRSVGIGFAATLKAEGSTALGPYAYASDTAPMSVALGPASQVDVESGMRVNAIPYLAKLPDATDASSGVTGDVIDKQLPTARRVASQTVMATEAIDLTSGTAYAELPIPANTILLPDSFDVVVVESSAPDGTPEIQIGPDDVTPAAYLAATPVTKTAVGGRDAHTPLVTDGITALRVSVVTAGTGTLKAKVVVRGYVMEI